MRQNEILHDILCLLNKIKFLQLVVRSDFDVFVNTNVVTPSNFPGVLNELTNEIARFTGDKTLFLSLTKPLQNLAHLLSL